MENILIEEALPIAAFSRLGLYDGTRYLLDETDLSALLSGRRTSLVNLQNLVSESFTIESLDAKLSLNTDAGSLHEIRLHPIYKEPKRSPDLSDIETDELISGEVKNIAKRIDFPDGSTRTIVFEYDSEIREFISYDPVRVEIPIQVNGEQLDEKKKKDFALGRIVQLTDGTMIQHRATEPQGILASRTALVLTVLKDGTTTSFLMKNLAQIMDVSIRKTPLSAGFESAFLEMKKTDGSISDGILQQREFEEFKSEYTRGYGHSVSR